MHIIFILRDTEVVICIILCIILVLLKRPKILDSKQGRHKETTLNFETKYSC
jgi:hypothetical protein